MRILLRLLLVLAVLAAAVGGYAWHRAGFLDEPLRPGGGTHTVDIPAGASFGEVVARLQPVLRDPFTFEIYARYRKAGRNIKAGTYTIDLSMTPRELLRRLEEGALPEPVRVTIPEGFNRWQIADRLAEKGLVDRAEFLARVEAEGLEGRLFPDTYHFDERAGLDAVVARLTGRFDAVYADVLADHPEAEALQREPRRAELLTLASLVEKEARTDRDRRLVARVFRNRLARKMRLQTDPTCVYGAEIYREVPHPRFCKDPRSRYSTYVIDGLPPTPIANPGRAALEATLRPADAPGSERLLYFVARRDGSGEHVFNETLEAHNEAVERYLKKRDP